MAPGLNGRQAGTVPKNKPRSSGSQSQRSSWEALMPSTSLEWEPVLDQNSRSRSHRKISSTHSEAEADSIRCDLATSLSSIMTSQMRYEDNETEGSSQDAGGTKMRVNIPDKKQVINKITQIQDYIQQTATLMNALKSSDSTEGRSSYQKMCTVMEELKYYETKLVDMLKRIEAAECDEERGHNDDDDDDDEDEEAEQGDGNNGSGNNADSNEEDLIRRSEESKKKLELLKKRKQELIELQEKARKQLQEAQMEQSRLVARASTLNQDINSNRYLDLSVQQLSQRLKNAQQLYKTSNQINEGLGDNRESTTEEPEHPDEDQVEMSDTETDFQLVSDKVAELNAMKAQLAQIQKIMANISLDQSSKDGTSTPAESCEERRDQGSQQQQQQQQQQRSMRGDSSLDETGANALKLEQAKLKLNQLTQLLEIAKSTQGAKGIPPGYLQLMSNMASDEGASSRRSPSPSCSGKSQQRPSEEAYAETMQLMTRELEERTAAMKEEHERLVAARQELESLARKIPLAKGERLSLSLDDSGSEAPCLTNVTLDSNGRNVDCRLGNGVLPMEAGAYMEGNPCIPSRSGHPKMRQRGVWSSSTPTMNAGGHDKKCKNEDISRGLHQLSGNGSQRDHSSWSPSPTVSFCDGASYTALQTQNQIEKSGNLCGRMINEVLQRNVRPEEITIEELYAQHQMLTRTVAQCSHLIWLQQKQIIELRNSLMLQQSTMFQGLMPQASYGNPPPPPPPPPQPQPQPQRNVPLSHHPYQFNPVPAMPYATLGHPTQAPMQQQQQQQQPQQPQQEQSYLSPNQTMKLNAGAMHNVQGNQDFGGDQYYQHGMSYPHVHDALDYHFRYNYARPGSQHANSNSNVNQNVNQNGASGGLNNRMPVAGMSCLGPEDSGALNNQVPPGNRTNNYWDNFRSYSRQNLLSHSKSNEDTDANRRSTTIVNQERPLRETSSSGMIPNNAPAGLAGYDGAGAGSGSSPLYGAVDAAADYDECQFAFGHGSSGPRQNQAQVSRSRSVEAQSNRSSAKNESRNHDNRNLTPKNEAGTSRARNPEAAPESIRSLRNDVTHGGRNADNSRNFVQLVRGLDGDEARRGGMNKKRMDKARSRNDGRGNLNNRANSNYDLPIVLRDNVYSEVTNFIRANESRPQFLIQLFRDLQLVTTDQLRQRTLDSIQETVSAINLTERNNINGSNLNIIDNRNSMRENRSNLNRNQAEEPRIDDIVCQLREGQNAIRQGGGGGGVGGIGVVGVGAAASPGNVENANLSNIRNPRSSSSSNAESDGLRGLRTYFEANLCNFGHNSALENPNLSNIRENLTRRGAPASELDGANPKNLYMSMYDNVGRRNQDSNPEYCRYVDHLGGGNNDSPRACSNQYAQGTQAAAIFPGDNYGSEARDFCPEAAADNKAAAAAAGEGASFDHKKTSSDEDAEEAGGATALVPADWDASFTDPARSDAAAAAAAAEPTCKRSPCNCGNNPQELDNGDLAEADQTRSEAGAGAPFVAFQVAEPEQSYAADDNQFLAGREDANYSSRSDKSGCELETSSNEENPYGGGAGGVDDRDYSNQSDKSAGELETNSSEENPCAGEAKNNFGADASQADVVGSSHATPSGAKRGRFF